MSQRDALELLKKYGADRRVIAHVRAVRDYAMEIAGQADCDQGLVEAGALLHDIGRTRSHGMDHAVIGAAILEGEGVDGRIVRIVERHIGSGITPEEAKRLGLPPKDYLPETIEEKIVSHADNLIGSTERIPIGDAIAMARRKWPPSAVDRLIRMHFEVFRPDIVILDATAARATSDGPERVDELLRTMLERYDVLYKIDTKNDCIIVSLFGHDSKKAAGRLKECVKK